MMERVREKEVEEGGAIKAKRQKQCLRCEYPVPDRPLGCKGGQCANCGHPYPLGDCSD